MMMKRINFTFLLETLVFQDQTWALFDLDQWKCIGIISMDKCHQLSQSQRLSWFSSWTSAGDSHRAYFLSWYHDNEACLGSVSMFCCLQMSPWESDTEDARADFIYRNSGGTRGQCCSPNFRQWQQHPHPPQIWLLCCKWIIFPHLRLQSQGVNKPIVYITPPFFKARTYYHADKYFLLKVNWMPITNKNRIIKDR